MNDPTTRRDTPDPRPRSGPLQARIVALLLLVSLLPLAIVSAGAWITAGRVLEEHTLQRQEAIVRDHARSIERYLEEREQALELVARTHGIDQLGAPGALEAVFDDLRAAYGLTFVDLGVIDATGAHVAYVGPYDLLDRRYENAPWFGQVLAEGRYVSDVFLGHRQVPHCVIAVRRDEGHRAWILRATIDSAAFERIVRRDRVGEATEAFLIDGTGRLQTPSASADVLEPSGVELAPHGGVHHRRVVDRGVPMLQTTTWLQDERWMLVVQQRESTIRAPVRRATTWGAIVIGLAVLLVAITTTLSTRHLIHYIERADEQRDALSRDLMRSARLASLGELASGLAHEINNPLAIISAEQTNVRDLVGEAMPAGEARDEVLESVASTHRQVGRCGQITAKMLQFGRTPEPRSAAHDAGELVEEIARLMRNQAAIRDIALDVEIAPARPPVRIDPTELQQVLVNLIHNAIHAIGERGRIEIALRPADGGVALVVRDDGPGISPEDLERVFQPFFTTKPVGQGTGLGLSVCHGLVRGWGGTITARSTPGQGAEFRIWVPAADGGEGGPDPQEVSR